MSRQNPASHRTPPRRRLKNLQGLPAQPLFQNPRVFRRILNKFPALKKVHPIIAYPQRSATQISHNTDTIPENRILMNHKQPVPAPDREKYS
jgi:hypothetical protein